MERNIRERIFKYPIKIVDYQDVPMQGKRILTAKMQNGTLCLWTVCDPAGDYYNKRIWILGTGHPMPKKVNLSFINSVIDGPFVWHVFEEQIE